MKTSANIATYPPRINGLRTMIKTIYDQFDIIRIYFNEYEKAPHIEDPQKKIQKITGRNLYDNGKFIGLEMVKEHEYYFTMDDDLLYPSNYVDHTIEQIEKFDMIITYHGRTLKAKDVNYYKGIHQTYSCLRDQHGNFPIDVAGTGVTAFSTQYFMSGAIAESEYIKMSDLVFSLEVAKKRKLIGVMEHKAGWIGHIENKETIYETEVNKSQSEQIKLANQIYILKHED